MIDPNTALVIIVSIAMVCVTILGLVDGLSKKNSPPTLPVQGRDAV